MRSGSGSTPSRGEHVAEDLREDVHGVQRRAAVHPGVQVALARAHAHVEVVEPAAGHVERRDAAREHARVEDDGGVRAALVLLQPLDDRVAAELLLPVAGEAHVDRQLARERELARPPSGA